MGGICETCPFSAALKTAETLAQTFVDDTDKQNAALGGLKVTSAALDGMASQIDCPGPMQDQQNQVDCPIREVSINSRSFGVGIWPEVLFAIELGKVTDSQESVTPAIDRPGTYL